ncbi:D-mannonate dehydratase [Pelagibacterium luteolum]|uniref:Mannonate dehydratase n=2 Tax=Pelagibacterium luteolum TaxID=440168 RepID=A0A1G7SUW4_9HYPH|nr:D-mannonate dehydratase [Pelagibacterium luteolum]
MTKRLMRQTWRWFGPDDKVSLRDAHQAGAEGIVTALYHIPPGAIWTPEDIETRLHETRFAANGAKSGLYWDVVESLPVSEAIKTQTGDWREHVANWTTSLEHLAAAGLETVCYNFMPILDWTRTNHRQILPNGGTAMVFDLAEFAAFDIHILARPDAAGNYREDIVREAARHAQKMSEAQKDELSHAIIAGLAGAVESWTLETLRRQLDRYSGVSSEQLRRHHFDFLEAVVPTAERLGLRLCCHPDDPPFSLLGLPKVASTENDYRLMVEAVDSPANGITFCTGSLGSRDDADLPGFVDRLGSKIAFCHLRNVTTYHKGTPTGFLEDDHLHGNVDMVAVVGALLREQERRRDEGRADWQIPMRPDHGHDLLDDAARGARPGYPAVGRLKGLAELRGVMHALAASN